MSTCRVACAVRLRAVWLLENVPCGYRSPTCRVPCGLSSAYVPCASRDASLIERLRAVWLSGAPITCTIVPRRFCNQLVYRVGRLYTWNTQRAALANVARRSRAQIVAVSLLQRLAVVELRATGVTNLFFQSQFGSLAWRPFFERWWCNPCKSFEIRTSCSRPR